MRHGKSDWDSAPVDFDRPLAERGRRDAPRIARALLDLKLQPDVIISSPAKRARQTAKAVQRVFRDCESSRSKLVFDDRIYAADLNALLDVLADIPSVPVALLVGHNPGLESLLYMLAHGHMVGLNVDKLMPTAATACLEMPDDWTALSRGSAKLMAHLLAKELG